MWDNDGCNEASGERRERGGRVRFSLTYEGWEMMRTDLDSLGGL